MPVPVSLQTVQRAEFGAEGRLWLCRPSGLVIWVLITLTWSSLLVGCLIMDLCLTFVKDGDLIAVVRHMIHAWGPDTVRVTKGKGHATEADVEQGRV